MLEIDDSILAPEYNAFLREWARALGVPLDVLWTRIIAATIDGFLYTEKIPDYLPLKCGERFKPLRIVSN